MFERFTRSAREAVVSAQELGRRDSVHQIESGYLLLGAVQAPSSFAARALARLGVEPASLAECVRSLEPDALDADALAGIGVDLEAVRAQVEAAFGAGALDAPADDAARRTGDDARRRGRLPIDPAAKKMLELALREAVRFKSGGIDTGHLLLAAARLDSSTAQRALAWFGHDRKGVEDAVVATWAEGIPE
jgi:ATP-dependent Clp protease ATP-binding subunit ClpA